MDTTHWIPSQPYAARAEPGKHDFSGNCVPRQDGSSLYPSQETFSVGVFEWLRRGRKGDGKCCKAGPVKVRIKGLVADPAAVLAKAKEIAAALDAGTYTGPKNVKV